MLMRSFIESFCNNYDDFIWGTPMINRITKYKKDGNKMTLFVEVPGIDKKDIKIKTLKDKLNIFIVDEDGKQSLRNSYSIVNVEDAVIKAKLDKGILTIELKFNDDKETEIEIE